MVKSGVSGYWGGVPRVGAVRGRKGRPREWAGSGRLASRSPPLRSRSPTPARTHARRHTNGCRWRGEGGGWFGTEHEEQVGVEVEGYRGRAVVHGQVGAAVQGRHRIESACAEGTTQRNATQRKWISGTKNRERTCRAKRVGRLGGEVGTHRRISPARLDPSTTTPV